MSPFTIDEAQIVALFMECIFYGLYLATLYQCLRSLLWSESDNTFKRQWNWPMLVVALALGLFATLDVAFGLRHNLDAFVYYHGPGGAVEELHNISYWVNVMKMADYVAQTFIGDAILIYRCWVVYNNNWLVIVPSILLWLGCTTCGAVTTYIFATLKSQTLISGVDQVDPWMNSLLTLTLTMNILTTSLIVYRIWSVNRKTSSVVAIASSRGSRHPSRLQEVMKIIIESAAMYTVSVIILFITYITGNNAQYGTSDNVVQIIGISFNLIIIRVNSGNAFKSTTQRSIGHSSSIFRSQSNAAGRPRQANNINLETVPDSTFAHSKVDGILVTETREDFTDHPSFKGPQPSSHRQWAIV